MFEHGNRLEHSLAAADHLSRCELCEHRCGVNRLIGQRGPCHAGPTARVFRHRVEYGEETELIPSHLFYLSGCDLRCKFCIAEANAFNPHVGTELTGPFLREALSQQSDKRPTNLQWVGGEPNIHLPSILRVMSEVDVPLPITWKSDFYGTPATLALLDGVVDTFVADFKFGNDVCASEIARVPRYVSTITRNLKTASSMANLIVRHLILPGHHECCLVPIVRWMAEHLPRTKFSLRDGYSPRWQAKHDPQLQQFVSARAAEAALSLARDYELNLVH